MPDFSLTPVSFDNTCRAFAVKSDIELNRSRWLFKLMNSPALVKLFASLTIWGLRIKLPIEQMIKKTVFRQFCGGETIEETGSVVKLLSQSHIGSILDYSVEGKERDEDFEKTKHEVIRIIRLASANRSIPYTSLKLTGIAKTTLLEKINNNSPLNEADKKDKEVMLKRLEEICGTAHQMGVSIYFDAEESWIQDAIDQLAETMMRRYNSEKAIVLTTLQMYRHDRLKYLTKLVGAARNEKFFLGIKLVRGAYWEKENERAHQNNYPSPVHALKENTDADFNKALDMCLGNIDIITLCAGTHNEASSLHLLMKMKELNLANNHPHIYFSQLYGMSDHISFNLAAEGYNVTKYLPYGPVKSVIPYLIRRAEENTSIAGQMGRELRLINLEKERRKNF